VSCDKDGRTNFDRIRYRQHDASVFLYAFDLIELNGDDLRREQIEARKAELANLMRNLASALRSRRRRWVHSHGER
jgi:ATP-dependent DNA ligase